MFGLSKAEKEAKEKFWKKFKERESENFEKMKIQLEACEKQPLPIGLEEFHSWAERIIKKADLPATLESQKYTLANLILHMKPTEAFCEDLYFINCLRKAAANQVADYYRQKEYQETKDRLAKQEAEKAYEAP